MAVLEGRACGKRRNCGTRVVPIAADGSIPPVNAARQIAERLDAVQRIVERVRATPRPYRGLVRRTVADALRAAAGAPLLCAILLGGCDGADSSERDALELWAMGSEGEVVETLLPEFRRRHPDIEVRVQRLPWSAAHEKLLTAHVGGTMPDVFQLGNTWIPEMVALGALEPLQARASASTSVVLADYFPGVLDTNLIGDDGKEDTPGAHDTRRALHERTEKLRLYSLPWYVDTRLLFYRSDLLERAGVAQPPQTWAQWLAAMDRVRRSAGDSRYAIFLPVDEWQPPVILALQRNARLLRDGDRFGNFRSQPVREAMAFYLSLFEGGMAPQRAAAQIANLYQEFGAGYFTFFITGPWNLRELDKRLPKSLAWSTAAMPAPQEPGPGLSLAGGASLGIASTSQRKDAAWKLLEYLAEPAQQAAFYRASGSLPARRSAWDDPSLAGDVRAQAFRVQLERVVATPKIPEWERIASKISLYVERMVRGDVTLEQGLADLDADVDAVLEKRRWMVDERTGAPD